MSLLTSPNTTKQQLKFFQKMERHYHRRGGSQYLHKSKQADCTSSSGLKTKQQINLTTRVPEEGFKKMKELMQQFMEKVKVLIRQFSMIDHYYVLEELRKHEFFSDVAILIDGNLYQKIQFLQKQIISREQKIDRLRRQLKTLQKQRFFDSSQRLQKLDSINNKNQIKYNPSKSVAANIYCHAKAMNQEDFINFYNKTSLSNPITLKKVQCNNGNLTSMSNSNKVSDKSVIISKINQLMVYGKDHNNEELIKILIENIRQSFNLSTMSKECKNPCCLQKPNVFDTRLNKAKTLMYSNFNRTQKPIYKNDMTQQYFRRYYINGSFNVHDVTSVTRTKLQQMERIEVQYNKNLKARKKYQQQHRYSYSYTKDKEILKNQH